MGKSEQRRIVNLIKDLLRNKGITVARVVLFGSRVSGKARLDSDLDVVIVSKNFEKKDIFQKVKMARGVHESLVKDLRIPVDILYYSPSEWKTSNSLIVHAAKESGVQFS